MSGTNEEARIAWNNTVCRSSAKQWRDQAECLRERAAEPRLAAGVTASLLRSAESCDEQAAWWQSGIVGETAETS